MITTLTKISNMDRVWMCSMEITWNVIFNMSISNWSYFMTKNSQIPLSTLDAKLLLKVIILIQSIQTQWCFFKKTKSVQIT